MPRILTEPINACREPEVADLTADQRKAFSVITGRLTRGDKVTKLTGFAGCGKTWLLIRVAAWAARNGFQVSVAAPTHKAVGVIREKIANWQQSTGNFLDAECSTIHSLLGLLLAPDMENDTGERILTAAPVSTKREEMSSRPKALVITDEASMIGQMLRFHIDQASHVQWLFVGDSAQLPPVGEGPSAFMQNPHATLTRIMRQAAGSEIINLATRIRRGDLSLSFTLGGQVRQASSADEMLAEAVKQFRTEEFDRDPSHARIMVFRNAKRELLNRLVRQELLPDAPPFVDREWLVMSSQFSPDTSEINQLFEYAKTFVKGEPGYGSAWRRAFERKEMVEEQRAAGMKAGAFLHVSQEIRILHVSEQVVRIGQDAFSCHRLTVVTKAGESEAGEIMQLPVLNDEVKPLHLQRVDEAMAAAVEIRRQMTEFTEPLTEAEQEAVIVSPEWKELDLVRRRHWGRYFTLLDTFADVDRPYCLTTHKSQGSTYRHAFVDAADLLSSGGMRRQLLYVAATRASDTLTFCL